MALAGQNKGYGTVEPQSDKSGCLLSKGLSKRESTHILLFTFIGNSVPSHLERNF